MIKLFGTAILGRRELREMEDLFVHISSKAETAAIKADTMRRELDAYRKQMDVIVKFVGRNLPLKRKRKAMRRLETRLHNARKKMEGGNA